jgi:DNA-directed RNA polymerase specialized sigma24 family protein
MSTQNVFEIDPDICHPMSDESVSAIGNSAEQPCRPPVLVVAGAAAAESGDTHSSDAAEQHATAAAAFGRQNLERLIAQEYPGLRLLVAHRAGDPQLGADLLHDAICIALEKSQQGQLRRPEQMAGYVFQVAMNLLRNQRRVLGNRPERRARPTELDEVAEAQIAERVKRLLGDLGSARDRRMLVRLYLDEADKDALCREFELAPLQFDKIVHRARKRLRRLLESRGLKRSDFLCVLALL